jgi:hypothetical protein
METLPRTAVLLRNPPCISSFFEPGGKKANRESIASERPHGKAQNCQSTALPRIEKGFYRLKRIAIIEQPIIHYRRAFLGIAESPSIYITESFAQPYLSAQSPSSCGFAKRESSPSGGT